MAAVPSCSMKKHKAFMWQPGGWNVEQKVLGCVVKPNTEILPTAPTDLRTEPLPNGWNTMTSLRLENGNTEYLPNFPPSVTTISVTNNKLKELPPLPASLRILNADKNELQTLPPLPVGLTRLSVKNNKLTTLPSFPTRLTDLYLTHNELASIPSLAGTEVEHLGLGYNELTALPPLPQGVRSLGCSNNQIQEISNLPPLLRILNCSNNPLRTVKIENLKRITTLIMSNCGLKEIPILPDVEFDAENFEQGPALDPIEDRREYFFDGNELTPEFRAIYNRYRAGGVLQQLPSGDWVNRIPGSTRQFRNEVLEEHRRLLRQRAKTVGAISQTLKGPTGPAALKGNYGPTNLIARFITGLPGTIEQQRLGVLEQREALRNVPLGTAANARSRIANVVARPNASNFLKERAKLYVRKENIEAARSRYEAEIEAERKRYEAEIEAELERKEMDAKKKILLRVYSKFLMEARLLELESESQIIFFKQELSDEEIEKLDEKFEQIQSIENDLIYEIVEKPKTDRSINMALVEKIRSSAEGDDKFKDYLKKQIRNGVWWLIHLNILGLKDKKMGIIHTAETYPQIYESKHPEKDIKILDIHLENFLNLVFGDKSLEDEETLQLLEYLSKNIWNFLEPADTNNKSSVSEEELKDEAAAVNAVVAVLENDNVEENLAGGRRKHRRSTPRNRKSKRATRKQK